MQSPRKSKHQKHKNKNCEIAKSSLKIARVQMSNAPAVTKPRGSRMGSLVGRNAPTFIRRDLRVAPRSRGFEPCQYLVSLILLFYSNTADSGVEHDVATPGRRYELEKGSHCTCVGSPTGTAVTRWREMRARMCLWVCVHVCVCLFVNDLFFRQSRMACSVYQSKSPCRSHD